MLRKLILNIPIMAMALMGTPASAYAHGGEVLAFYFGGIFFIGGAISGVLKIRFDVQPWLSFLVMVFVIYAVFLLSMLMEPLNEEVEFFFYLFPLSIIGSFGAIPFVVAYFGVNLVNDCLMPFVKERLKKGSK